MTGARRNGKANRVKTLPVAKRHLIPDSCGSFSVTGSIRGMKEKYYGTGALLVRCGSYIYNVSDYPKVYDEAH